MNALRKLIGFLRPYWLSALIAPLLMLLEVAMDLMQPQFMQRIVDVGIAPIDLSIVLHTGVLMAGVALIGMVGGAGNTVFSVRAAQGVGADLRSVLFRKIQALSFGNLNTLKTGELVTRLTNDVTQVQEIVLVLLRVLIRTPFMLLGSVIMVVLTSPRLAVIMFILIPLLFLILATVLRRAQPMFSEVQRRLDGLSTVMQENLAGMRVVKAFVR